MNYTAKIRTSSQAANLLRDHLGDLDLEGLWVNQAIVYNAISMPPGQTQKAFPEANDSQNNKLRNNRLEGG